PLAPLVNFEGHGCRKLWRALKGTDLVSREGHDLKACGQTLRTHAAPWKSGASAPREPSKIERLQSRAGLERARLQPCRKPLLKRPALAVAGLCKPSDQTHK